MHDFIALDEATLLERLQPGVERTAQLSPFLGRHVVRIVFLDDDHLEGGAFGKVHGLVEDDATVFDVGFEGEHSREFATNTGDGGALIRAGEGQTGPKQYALAGGGKSP